MERTLQYTTLKMITQNDPKQRFNDRMNSGLSDKNTEWIRRTINVINIIAFQIPVIRMDRSSRKGLLERQSNAINLLLRDFNVVKRGHWVRLVAVFQWQLISLCA